MEGNTGPSYVKYLLILLVVFLLLAVCGVCIVILVFLFVGRNSNEAPVSKYDYQYTETNPSTHETRHGFVQIIKKIPENEIIGYHNEETGGYVAISNFGGEDYQCSGSCSCASQRRVSSVLTRGLYIMFAAFSAGMALNVAKDSFQEECVRQFSETCGPSEIVTKVDYCKKVTELGSFSELEEEVPLAYECRGYCVQNTKLESIDLIVDISEEIPSGCGSIGMEKKVAVVCEGEDHTRHRCREKAKTKFVGEYFNIFCEEQSVVKVLQKQSPERMFFKEVEKSACVGEEERVEKKYRFNVHCAMSKTN